MKQSEADAFVRWLDYSDFQLHASVQSDRIS